MIAPTPFLPDGTTCAPDGGPPVALPANLPTSLPVPMLAIVGWIVAWAAFGAAVTLIYFATGARL